jgi:hydroxymethylpyrimidine/phosphomethylpyrimidine kinase
MASRGVAYLAKGGDADGPAVEDVLVMPGAEPLTWSAPRIMTRHTHGTGCTLSSAIATGLGAGLDLVTAIEQGRAFVRAALGAAPGFGAGSGPLGHQAVQSSS